eukprot:TRINITY_DN5128_c1_g1_i3.p1 TRINITY_DN5128_c1_g1~~TRINITY_DN5128_c1_g1_i3.p1  ORF type:complete len:552 (+),score=61.77 TRINITY_DN5128_c1_g1_i3:30-1685(+)
MDSDFTSRQKMLLKVQEDFAKLQADIQKSDELVSQCNLGNPITLIIHLMNSAVKKLLNLIKIDLEPYDNDSEMEPKENQNKIIDNQAMGHFQTMITFIDNFELLGREDIKVEMEVENSDNVPFKRCEKVTRTPYAKKAKYSYDHFEDTRSHFQEKCSVMSSNCDNDKVQINEVKGEETNLENKVVYFENDQPNELEAHEPFEINTENITTMMVKTDAESDSEVFATIIDTDDKETTLVKVEDEQDNLQEDLLSPAVPIIKKTSTIKGVSLLKKCAKKDLKRKRSLLRVNNGQINMTSSCHVQGDKDPLSTESVELDKKPQPKSNPDAKPYLCTVCGQAFHMQKTMESHCETEHPDATFKCELCEKIFKTRKRLRYHLHITHTEKPKICPHCGKKYKTKKDFEIHIEQHATEKPFSCDVCSKPFAGERALNYHKRTHTKDKSLQTCKTCGKSVINLVDHNYIVHSDEKRYKCDQCGAAYKRMELLKFHMNTHTGERPYKCDKCEKSYNRPVTLKNHLLTHNSDVTFQCEVCSRTFSFRSALKRHLRRVHGHQ